MIHTNRCKHCGEPKEKHLEKILLCPTVPDNKDFELFYDSGEAALDAHKEELYEISIEIKNATKYFNGDTHVAIPITISKKLQRILNQIEKEK